MKANKEVFSIVKMCEVLKVSKSGYYKWLKFIDAPPTAQELMRETVKPLISQSFHESFGTYGSPRIQKDLEELGYPLSAKYVAIRMQELGLSALPKKRFIHTTDSNHTFPIYPNLLNQQFKVDAPDQVWVSDITYIRTLQGWLYLASIMDLFSRKIIAWKVENHMRKELPLEVLRQAILLRRPKEGIIHHSDRGAQYCSNDYIKELKTNHFQISMSRKGNPYDNACIESFHATIKKELIYKKRFKAHEEAIYSVNRYISGFYNEQRRHSTLAYRSPNQFERQYYQRVIENVS
jgi:putative transposase